MNEDRIEMSQRERDRLQVMSLVLEGKRTQGEAARLLGVTGRQVRRIERRLLTEGDVGVVHKLRGRPSNHRIAAEHRRRVVAAYREELSDFGPTFAAEKLAERGLRVAARTLREWLVAEGLWKPRRRRAKHRRRRERRACFGELVQADGSVHDWLEGRGPELVLLVMIDDATSKTVARFYPSESTEGYMDLLRRYIRKHGRMVAIYADRHSIFFATDSQGRPVLTQFGRALEELGIELIPAGSPQAKGRVERFNGTGQDRLVKELRLAGATTAEEANEVLEQKFLAWFNRRRTLEPASPNDAHRPGVPAKDLASILSIQHGRRVANDYTIQVHGRVYQLLKPVWPGERGGRVIVEQRLDGTMRVRFKDRYLKFEALAPPTAPGALPPDEASKSRTSRFGASPRSLSPERTPAEGATKEGCAIAAAQPSAVRPVAGRSGRTPAEPCPPDGEEDVTRKEPWRPPADHPWRKPYKLTGHS